MMFVENIVDNKLVESWTANERALQTIEPAFLPAPLTSACMGELWIMRREYAVR